MKKQVLIVGAGVVGLTTAIELYDRYGEVVEISLIAKDLPGDQAIFYTSPKAGAHWVSTNKKENKDWHLTTYMKLKELSKIPEAFVKEYPLYLGDVVQDGEKAPIFEEPWFKDLVDDYKFLGNDAKFPGIQNLHCFKSFTISTTLYLTYLLSQIRSRGMHIRRYTINSLKEAETLVLHNGKIPDLIVNCTGLQYNFLKDGKDPKLIPVRGHVLVIENNLPYQVTFEHDLLTKDSKEGEFLMLFPRPEGGSILGGIYDKDFLPYDTSIDNAYVKRLVNKASHYIPDLLKDATIGSKIKIASHTIGFRPERIGGARIGVDENNNKIVHNYGNGNSGYIESWGCASNTVKIIGQILFNKESKL